MSDKVASVPAKAARRNGLAMAALAFLVVAILVAAAATGPYIFKGATLEGEVAAQLRAATGLRVVSSGRASFSLLPSPRLELTDLHLQGPTLVVDAGALEGDVRLLPLIVGRLELSAATLVRPKLTIDLDSGETPSDSTIGRALHGLAPTGDAGERLGTVTLVEGTAVLHARALPRPPKLDEIDVTVDWPDIDSPATLTGSLMVDDVATDVAAWVAQPSTLMRGETSPIALRVHAAPLDLSANGDVVAADKTLFHGHMALSAPSLPALLARLGEPTPVMMAPFANIALKGNTTIAIDRDHRTSVDLQGLELDLDGNRYEGTLAWESGAKPSLSGTLATDTLTLAPFLAAEPSLADAQHRWTRSALVVGGAELIDLDLRLSATHLRIAPFTIDDAALSVMTRGRRTEVSLNEGKAYGGAAKGRASIGMSAGIVSLRGAGTLDNGDVASLSWDMLGRQVAAGTLSGAFNIDTSGDSPAALMAHLQGWAKGSAHDGEVSGLDLGGGLRAIESGRGGLASLRQGRTPFASLVFALHFTDGTANVEDAAMTGPDAVATVGGTADIGNRDLDLGVTAASPGGARDKSGTRLAVGIRGSFDAPVIAPHVVAPRAPPPLAPDTKP